MLNEQRDRRGIDRREGHVAPPHDDVGHQLDANPTLYAGDVERDHNEIDGHLATVAHLSQDGLRRTGDHNGAAVPSDHRMNEAHCADVARLCAEIREHHRARVDFHRAEKRQTLQMKAICRRIVGGDKDLANKLFEAVEAGEAHELFEVTIGNIGPMLESRKVLAAERKRREKLMQKLAPGLPAWGFVESVHGFGALGFAQIVGEAGPLHIYSNPAKLWKRMGLAVIGGGAQRRVTGDMALVHGFSPERRSVMFCIGDSLIKKQNAYRELYLERKQYEVDRRDRAIAEATETGAEEIPEPITKMHAHRRGQRYAEKRLLRDLWSAWRKDVSRGTSE